MMNIKCQRCGKLWVYKGSKKTESYPQYVACPKCRTSVKMVEAGSVKK